MSGFNNRFQRAPINDPQEVVNMLRRQILKENIMSTTDEKGCDIKSATNTPHQIIQEQLHHLDRALNTIPYYGSEETKIVRSYLIAQIEALKWAAKLREI